jgi:hypothetical protein
MTPERWRAGGATLFVEASNRASLAGTLLAWRSVYCMDLSGDRVLRGRRYYDRRPLFAALDPELPALPPGALREGGDPLPAAGGPEAARPAFARRLERCVAGLTLAPLAEAGDDEVRFTEWQVDGRLGGEPVSFGVAERSDLRARSTLAYFDTLALATRLAAAATAKGGRAA